VCTSRHGSRLCCLPRRCYAERPTRTPPPRAPPLPFPFSPVYSSVDQVLFLLIDYSVSCFPFLCFFVFSFLIHNSINKYIFLSFYKMLNRQNFNQFFGLASLANHNMFSLCKCTLQTPLEKKK